MGKSVTNHATVHVDQQRRAHCVQNPFHTDSCAREPLADTCADSTKPNGQRRYRHQASILGDGAHSEIVAP